MKFLLIFLLSITASAQYTNTNVKATQAGSWSISNSSFGISGSLPAGTNAIGSITNTVFGSTQAGVWNVGLSTGSNVIGSISNTSFGITGTLPAFAATPTFNIGTGAFVDRTTAVAPYSNRLSDGTSFYDARSIRSLTSSDVVTIANPTSTTGLALEAGHVASMDATLALIKAKTDNIDVALSTRTKPADTQIVSVSNTPNVAVTSSVIPTGAATSALQTSGNASLTTIATNTPALGQALAAASSPVVLPAAQITALTPPTTVTVTQATGTNLHTVVDSGAVTANIGTTNGLALDSSVGTLNTSVNTLLKPASTLAAVTTVGAVTSITNPVSISGTVPISGSPGRSWTLASSTDSTSAVVTSMPAITGAVTANIGTSGSLNLETTQSAMNAKIPTGLTVKAASTAAVAADQALVVAISPNNTVPISAASLPLPTGAALDSSVNTLLKPASTLAAVTTVGTVNAVTAITNALPTGTNSIGQVTTNAGTNTSTASLNLETTQAAMNAKIPALGQTTMSASQPVTIASNQTAIPTSRSWTTAASTDSTQAWLRDGLGNPLASLTDGNGNNALEVAMASTGFVFSTTNSSTIQLASLASFTGTIETAQNQQSISLLLTSDQNGILTVNQYITNAATFKVVPIVFTITANTQFSRSFPINGNFVNVTFQNTGGATTTTFNLNTAYGTIPASTARGNMPMSLEEVSGLPFVTSLKGVQATNALPVQNLLDSGRVLKSYSATFTAATTEALVSMTPIADGVAGGAATSFAVTAAKRLRLSQMCVTTRNAGVATQGVVVQLRMINTGAVTATSPLVGTASAGTSTAVANVASGGCISFPDGMEMSGTMQFGVSQIGTATANNTVVVYGFEY